MNILLAPDSFKGCLTSYEVCAALSKGINKVNLNTNIMQFPSSDGGEGFCDCMQNIFGGITLKREVTFPLGDRGTAEFVYCADTKTAYIELASAAGLHLVSDKNRSILSSTTYGVGELIREAVLTGAKTIVIGLGGSATNDCGIGILSALGMRFFDKNNTELKALPSSLGSVAYSDSSQMLDMSDVSIIAACDVTNPLCGSNGAAEVFSRQKGASDTEVTLLDSYAHSFSTALGIDPDTAGYGAAGGAGAALMGILNAHYVSGASLLINSESFKNALAVADLVITGEGNTDAQTAQGKLVSVVANAAKSVGVKTIVISGGVSDGYEVLYDCGVTEFYSLSDCGKGKDYCIKNASALLENIVSNVVLSI